MSRDRWPVAGLTLLAAGLYSTYGMLLFRSYRLTSYDLVIFDQAIRNYSRLHAPVSPVKGVHNEFGPAFNLLGDHFSPALALFSPLYWIWADPRMLLIGQSLCFAAGVPLVWVMARRALGRGAAYAFAVAFVATWPLQIATGVGFHEVALAVPLILLAFERLQAGRAGQAAVAALGLLLVKEDLGLVVAAFGVLLAWRGRRRLGAGVAVAGIAATVLIPRLVIPAFGGRGDYYSVYYADFREALPNPVSVLQLAFTPEQKWQTLLWLGAAVGFLVISPAMLLAVPLLAERFLSENPNHWGTGQFYNAYLVPILFVAAIETLQRLGSRRRRPAQLLAIGVAAVSLVLCAWFPLRELARPATWRLDAKARAAASAVSAVPDQVTVEADNRLGPALTSRTTVWLLDRTPRGAPWVIADVRSRNAFPFRSLAERQERVRLLERQGYRVVRKSGPYVVLHRPEGR